MGELKGCQQQEMLALVVEQVALYCPLPPPSVPCVVWRVYPAITAFAVLPSLLHTWLSLRTSQRKRVEVLVFSPLRRPLSSSCVWPTFPQSVHLEGSHSHTQSKLPDVPFAWVKEHPTALYQ